MQRVDVVCDTECDDLLPKTSKVHIIVVRQLGTGYVKRFHDAAAFRAAIPKFRKVIWHAGLSYDLPVLRKVYGIPFKIGAKQDEWDGHPCEFIDTLHLSQLLNPDRPGGHSIENFAKLFGKEKVGKDITDWSTPTEYMFQRCESDTEIGELTYHYLLKEASERMTQ